MFSFESGNTRRVGKLLQGLGQRGKTAASPRVAPEGRACTCIHDSNCPCSGSEIELQPSVRAFTREVKTDRRRWNSGPSTATIRVTAKPVAGSLFPLLCRAGIDTPRHPKMALKRLL